MLLRFTTSTVLLLSCLCSAAWAQEDNFNFNGFVGLGYIQESANNFVSLNGDDQEIVEVGLRFSYDYSSRLSVTGQVGYRRFGEYANDYGPRIDYAQITYLSSLFDNSEQRYSIGRVKNQLGLYNLARDIPLSRPSIVLPQSAYLEIWRNLFLSTDGVSLTSNIYLDHGVLSGTLTYGRVQFDDNFNKNMLGDSVSGSWTQRSNLVADLRYTNELYKIGASYHAIKPNYNAQPDDSVPFVPVGNFIQGIDGVLDMQSYFLFAQLYLDQFEFSAEYTYRNVDIQGFTASQSFDRSMEGYYFQVAYSPSSDLTLTTRYEDFYRLAKYKHGVYTPNFSFEPYYNNARSLTFSATYHIDANWTFMADFHLVKGSGFLAPFATPTIPSLAERTWTLGAIQAVYSF